jgi:hypothetical protein
LQYFQRSIWASTRFGLQDAKVKEYVNVVLFEYLKASAVPCSSAHKNGAKRQK